jgi:chromosomal replication initiation ATPase DnaA
MDNIKKIVAEVNRVSVEDIDNKVFTKPVKRARKMFYTLVCHTTGDSIQKVAKQLGITAERARKAVHTHREAWMNDIDYKADYERIKSMVWTS